MRDRLLIATLIASDLRNRTAEIFCEPHNQLYYVGPTRTKDSPLSRSSSATATDDGPFDEPGKNYETAHRLILTPNLGLKRPGKGFCFGSNPEVCDILLRPRGGRISGEHFWIQFTRIDGHLRLILKDVSRHGTAVGYSGNAMGEKRKGFIWVLDLEKQLGKCKVEVFVDDLQFIVDLAIQDGTNDEHERIMGISSNLEDQLDTLAIFAPTGEATPENGRQFPIYLSLEVIGQGAFGIVDKVINVSTARTLARKQFIQPGKGKKSLKGPQKEIRILKGLRHENIVEVLDARQAESPYLVMPYFPLGNLNDERQRERFSKVEILQIFRRGLKALKYLHERHVAHRDLKPDNILVASRNPLLVKVADFGLASDDPTFKTWCGTLRYIAPELDGRGRYTFAVDLWSLGVIVLELAYGLPHQSGQTESQSGDTKAQPRDTGYQPGDTAYQPGNIRLGWCHDIVKYTDALPGEPLVSFLRQHLLQTEPSKRVTASDCLKKAHQSELMSGMANDDGSTTPKLDPVAGDGSTEPRQNDATGNQNSTNTQVYNTLDGVVRRADGAKTNIFSRARGEKDGEISLANIKAPLGDPHGHKEILSARTEQSQTPQQSSPSYLKSSKRPLAATDDAEAGAADRPQVKGRSKQDSTCENLQRRSTSRARSSKRSLLEMNSSENDTVDQPSAKRRAN